MTDNALKTPFNLSLITAADRRADNFRQSQAKSIPSKVTKVDKDFVTVSFEPQNGIWTLPQMKIPQSFSRYGREPTQVGDMGYAVPSEYNTQTLTGLGGSYTNFFPKGNLTPLSFQPFSKTQDETRDYDQYTMTGGPKGVKIIQSTQQPKEKPPGNTGQPQPTSTQRRLLGMSSRARQRWLRQAPRPALQDTQSTPKAYMEINDKGLITHQSPDGKHQVLVDEEGKKVALNAPHDHTVYLGGPGKNPDLYAFVATIKGPSVNVKAKYVNQDET
jgi:hypothetical protein